MDRPIVEFDHVTKVFGDQMVARDITFSVHEGELLTLLGPSGCGKTTTLRMVAGFEAPTSGTVRIDGEDQTGRPPYQRRVNTVFQHYALFPHLSVEENVGFGLAIRKRPRAEIDEKVRKALELVKLAGSEKKFPSQLSGGQRQRVALARALVLEPKVLLLDEPLGALDVKLRREMQVELKSLQRRLGITFVLVTHDQDEALVLSDRIAVMNHGRIEQLDTATAVYEQPATHFVADFLGFTNFVPCVFEGRQNGELRARSSDGKLLSVTSARSFSAGERLLIAVRPEALKVGRYLNAASANLLTGTIEEKMYLGSGVKFLLRLQPGTRVTALVPTPVPPDLLQIERGAALDLSFDPAQAVPLPEPGGSEAG